MSLLSGTERQDGSGGGTLMGAIVAALSVPSAVDKAHATRSLYRDYLAGRFPERGTAMPPDRPARPARPVLLPPREMPKRRKAGTDGTRIALIHAVAHIELNAIDLALDLVARFATPDLPEAFVADWLHVADDESRHFLMLRGRLQDLGADYGDLPAHDGLWEAAIATSDDILARIAVAHMVLEARGLDVTPAMTARFTRLGDHETARILDVIYSDEITHVARASDWFSRLSGLSGAARDERWRALVSQGFRGRLKPPFNAVARQAAGMAPDMYEPLARD
ncbi:MAG: ferritin-like domain-containing protein [Minwuia sp.]|nr:ferritin-like domain-containing protein [Minwuia sp.]